MTKPTKWHVRQAKTQISLGIRPVWSVFAVRMKKAWVLSYPLSTKWRLWSDWSDAQADPSLRRAHSHFVSFIMRRLKRYVESRATEGPRLLRECLVITFKNVWDCFVKLHRWVRFIQSVPQAKMTTLALMVSELLTLLVHGWLVKLVINLEPYGIFWSNFE